MKSTSVSNGQWNNSSSETSAIFGFQIFDKIFTDEVDHDNMMIICDITNQDFC